MLFSQMMIDKWQTDADKKKLKSWTSASRKAGNKMIEQAEMKYHGNATQTDAVVLLPKTMELIEGTGPLPYCDINVARQYLHYVYINLFFL